MQKYGVYEEPQLSPKTADLATPRTCPLCGKRVEQHGNVFLCPEHGSKPFESYVEEK